MVNHEDRTAIEDLLRSYCYVVDDAQWDALSEVFTADVHFVNDFSGTDLVGIAPVTNWYRAGTHPAAHLLNRDLPAGLRGPCHLPLPRAELPAPGTQAQTLAIPSTTSPTWLL